MDQDVWNSAQDYLGQGVRMVAAAVVSAVVSATVVIAVGQSLLNREATDRSQPRSILVQTAG